MLHSRTCKISILANQPKFPIPSHITVNANFELFGNLPLLAVYSELFRIVQDCLAEKKLSDLSDIDGMYRDPETFSFDTDKGYIELNIQLLPFDAKPSDYKITFNPLQQIHETHLMVDKNCKKDGKISAVFGLCMLNVLNPIPFKKFCMIINTDEHILQANVVIDLKENTVQIGDTTTPNRMRKFEVEMAALFFGNEMIQQMIIAVARKIETLNFDKDVVYSTFIAPRSNRNLNILELVESGDFDHEYSA